MADRRPVVATGHLVDLRCPAKLAPDDDLNILVKTTRIDIFNKCGDSLVEGRQVFLEVGKVVAVGVPEAIGDGDAAGTSLDQPGARDQQLVVPEWGTIAEVLGRAESTAFSDPWIFAGSRSSARATRLVVSTSKAR